MLLCLSVRGNPDRQASKRARLCVGRTYRLDCRHFCRLSVSQQGQIAYAAVLLSVAHAYNPMIVYAMTSPLVPLTQGIEALRTGQKSPLVSVVRIGTFGPAELVSTV